MLGLAIQDFIKPKVNERRFHEKFTQSFTKLGVIVMNNFQLNSTKNNKKKQEEILQEAKLNFLKKSSVEMSEGEYKKLEKSMQDERNILKKMNILKIKEN